MLPGFRFLFVAVVLTMSIMIFGLGAASLLRAAHQEFASLPTRRAPPETIFTQTPDEPPRLALLSVEPRKPYKKPTQEISIPETRTEETRAPQAASPIEPPMPVALTAAEKTAGLQTAAVPAIQSADDAAKPPQPAPMVEAISTPASMVDLAPLVGLPDAPVAIQTPATQIPAEDSVATSGAAMETTASIAPPPTPVTVTSEAAPSSSRIAVLGGPPVEINPAAAKPAAAAQPRVTRKRAIRRRISARATRQASAPARDTGPGLATPPTTPLTTPLTTSGR